jgi:hypothetical protein
MKNLGMFKKLSMSLVLASSMASAASEPTLKKVSLKKVTFSKVTLKIASLKKDALKKAFLKEVPLKNTILLQATEVMGEGSTGGGQGIVDVEGNLHFLDIMEHSEIETLSSKLIDNSQIDLVEKVSCTDIWYSELMYYQSKRNKFEKKAFPKKVDYRNEINEAKSLLENADSVLLKASKDLIFKDFLIDRSFKITSLPLTQLQDASSIHSKYQTQIAYFFEGMTFFQSQALEKLQEKSRAVFVKEALRQARRSLGLSLTNQDLEVATRYIYKGELDKFSQSNFAKEYNSIIGTTMYSRDHGVSAVIYRGSESWTTVNLEKHQFSSMVGMARFAPGHDRHKRYTPGLNAVWSIKTGNLIDADECFQK